MNLRKITIKDQINLKRIYFDSIQSIDKKIYSKEQKLAWSSQAWTNLEFHKSITRGKGFMMEDINENIGFAIRYPENKLSLLYVSGKFKRKGIGNILIKTVEKDAIEEGISSLYTEASLLSYGLFLKNYWKIISKEKIIIQNIIFYRYKMFKNLQNF
tara:strand:+ start:98 stop:568 length:471 start_codon:yes stop_codon:yes gene_type:complete